MVQPGDPRQGAGFAPRQVDQPRAGFFTLRLVRGGPRVPGRILVVDGVFSAVIDGAEFGASDTEPARADGVMRLWHYGLEIEQAEYDRLLVRPVRPDPTKRLDLARLPSLF